jgi:hypothetical protein
MIALAVLCIPLAFVFTTKLFFLTGALISLAVMTAIVDDRVRDFRKGFIRKHPFLATLEFIYQAGPFLVAAAIVYYMLEGLLGTIRQGGGAGFIVMVGLYLFVASVCGISVIFAVGMFRAEMARLRQCAQQRRYVMGAWHLLNTAICCSIVAIVAYFAWRLLAKR